MADVQERNLIQGATGPWEVVVGLEVHAQIVSNAKLFSGASAAFGGSPNSHVSPIDAGMPGMLPSVNGFCIEQAVRTGLGLKAKINKHSVFERKNYFYPDLPNGYQISQYAEPLVGRGHAHDRPAGRRQPRTSASRGCTSRWMPARACTMRARMRRWWTSTARAWR